VPATYGNFSASLLVTYFGDCLDEFGVYSLVNLSRFSADSKQPESFGIFHGFWNLILSPHRKRLLPAR
jgi:hypothetical protein